MQQTYYLQGPIKFLGASVTFFIVFLALGYQMMHLHEFTLQSHTLVFGSLALAITFLWMYFDSKKLVGVQIDRWSVPSKYKYIVAGWVFLFVGLIAVSTASSMPDPIFRLVRLGMGGVFALIGLICLIVFIKKQSKKSTVIDKTPR